MFESMPDLRVTSRPVNFGTETWTSSTPERRTSADTLKPGEWTLTICILPPTRFEQEPRTPFGLVDPILNEARGSDIAKPVDYIVYLPKPTGESGREPLREVFGSGPAYLISNRQCTKSHRNPIVVPCLLMDKGRPLKLLPYPA